MQTVPVTVFMRPGCHLCEDMIAVLHEFAQELSISISTIDIDRDPSVSHALRQQYNALVPVLCVEGTEICHHFLDLEALKAGLDSRHEQHGHPGQSRHSGHCEHSGHSERSGQSELKPIVG